MKTPGLKSSKASCGHRSLDKYLSCGSITVKVDFTLVQSFSHVYGLSRLVQTHNSFVAAVLLLPAIRYDERKTRLKTGTIGLC